MKKIILLIFVTSLFAENNVSWAADMTMPSLRADCCRANKSFEVYKGSTCGNSYLSMFKPRCIELGLRRMFGETPDVKYYNHKEAIEYSNKEKIHGCPIEFQLVSEPLHCKSMIENK